MAYVLVNFLMPILAIVLQFTDCKGDIGSHQLLSFTALTKKNWST